MDVAPCDLVTAADVEAATGLTVVATDDDPILPSNGCVFDVGVSAEVFVSVDDGQGRSTGPAALFEAYLDTDGAEMIPDLGTAAVYSSAYRTLVVDAGDGQFFAVGLSGGYPPELEADREILLALGLDALARLG